MALFQSHADSARRMEVTEAVLMAQSAEFDRADAERSAEERRRFEERLNRLATALKDFQREYDASGGKLWPKKEADALKKAMQDLHLR